MKQRRRIYYTESQKAQMWERWQKGESLSQIAQLFDRGHSSIQGVLAESGGMSLHVLAYNLKRVMRIMGPVELMQMMRA